MKLQIIWHLKTFLEQFIGTAVTEKQKNKSQGFYAI